ATFVLLSGSLTFGVPLALAVRELLVLRPAGGGNWRDLTEPEPPPVAGPTYSGKLPDCLLPRPHAPVPELVD
ncbi:MAG TPA: hypothetical protein VHO91_23020, partial [Rhodopila sp.]|nr:hypothetical protein [Rhodopila sp.]